MTYPGFFFSFPTLQIGVVNEFFRFLVVRKEKRFPEREVQMDRTRKRIMGKVTCLVDT